MPDVSTIPAEDICPKSTSISGFTFLNFILSAISVGANVVSNTNRCYNS